MQSPGSRLSVAVTPHTPTLPEDKKTKAKEKASPEGLQEETLETASSPQGLGTQAGDATHGCADHYHLKGHSPLRRAQGWGALAWPPPDTPPSVTP